MAHRAPQAGKYDGSMILGICRPDGFSCSAVCGKRVISAALPLKYRGNWARGSAGATAHRSALDQGWKAFAAGPPLKPPLFMARIDHDDQHAAHPQQGQSFFHCFQGGFPPGGYGFVRPGQISQIKHPRIQRCLDIPVQIAVAIQNRTARYPRRRFPPKAPE